MIKGLTAPAFAVLLGSAVAIGQQPAQPAAGQAPAGQTPPGAQPGGRGGTPLTPAQAAAVSAANVNTALQAQIQAAAAAQAALVDASLAEPVNQADLRAKAKALADAETKLALARADLLVAVQQALRPLDTTQAIAALSGRGGGRGGPAVADNYDGFVSLFDGKTLDGWNGDPMFWSVKEGVLHAESTPEKVVGGIIPGNTFLIWKNKIRDFELKVDYRFVGNGNSGVQIRSRMSGPDPQRNADRPWGVSGYQMDMVTAGGTGSGVFYTEGGGFGLTPQGTAMRAFEGPDRTVQMRQIGTLGPGVVDAIKPGPEWNQYHIIANNNLIVAFINGRMVAMLVDDNRSGAQYAQDGLLALQMHAGQPFAIEFRNVYLKEIKPENLAATPLPAGQGRGGGQSP